MVLERCTLCVQGARAGALLWYCIQGAGACASCWVVPGEPNPADKVPLLGRGRDMLLLEGSRLTEDKAQLPCQQPGAQQAQFHRYPHGGTARLPCLRCPGCSSSSQGSRPTLHEGIGVASHSLGGKDPTPQHPFRCKCPLFIL